MASSPIHSWQIDGETMERVRDFVFGGSKITTDGDCNHEIKRCLLLGVGLPGLEAARTWVSVSPEMVGFPAPIR